MLSENTNQDRAIYLSIANGMLIRRMKEPTEKSKPRVTKTGSTVHEEEYRDVTGRITGATIHTTTYQGQEFKDWQFRIEGEDGGVCILQCKYDSRYAQDIAKRIESVDLSVPVRIMPWQMTVEGKVRSGVSIYQYGQKIAPNYTKDSAQQLPPLEQVMFKGEKHWDNTKLVQAVAEILTRVIGPGKSTSNDGNPPAAEAKPYDDANAPF